MNYITKPDPRPSPDPNPKPHPNPSPYPSPVLYRRFATACPDFVAPIQTAAECKAASAELGYRFRPEQQQDDSRFQGCVWDADGWFVHAELILSL